MKLKDLTVLWAITLALGPSASAAPEIAPRGNPPSLRLEFQSQPNTSDVRNFFTDFAKAQDLTLNDLGARVPSKTVGPILFLSLSNGKAIEITVTNAPNSGQYFVGIYEPQPDPSFNPIAAQLVADLKQKWPNVRRHSAR